VVEIVTAGLEEKTILDGITRRSVLELARERLQYDVRVVERVFTMGDIALAAQEGRLLEAFAAGTAYFITPVTRISSVDQEICLPMESTNGGKYTAMLKDWLHEIKYGRKTHKWAIVVPE